MQSSYRGKTVRLNPPAMFVRSCLFIVAFSVMNAASAATRLAVLEVESPALAKTATLLEAELFKLPEVEALDRMNIAAVLRERKLQSAFTADAVAARVALGKLLKADLLIILRTQDKPKPHAELIAFETRYGLRLCQESYVPTANPSADATALIERLRETVARATRPIDEIVAVPRFADRSLTTERVYIGEMAARLIEAELLRKPGTAVVELAEARALARELALVEQNADRRIAPLYLLGEYRFATNIEDRTASYQLVLSRGEKELDRVEVPSVAAGALPEQMTASAQQLLVKALGRPEKSPARQPEAKDADIESRRLVERARTFVLLGDDETALALYEAALTIKSDQPVIHAHAHAAMVRIVRKIKFQRIIGATYSAEQLRRELQLLSMLEDGLRHAEAYCFGSLIPNDTVHERPPLPGIKCFSTDSKTPAELRERVREYDARCVDLISRLLAYKEKNRVQDATLFKFWHFCVPDPGTMNNDLVAAWSKEHLTEALDARLELIRRFAWLKAEWHEWRPLLDFYNLRIDELREARPDRVAEYRAFLDRFETLKIPGSKPVVKQLREGFDYAINYRDKPQPSEQPKVAARPAGEAVVTRQELKLVILELDGRQTPVTAAPSCWIRVTDNCDLLLIGTRVYLMKRPGELRPIKVRALQPFNDLSLRDSFVCGDGKYAWIIQPGKAGFLAAIDVEHERVWELTPENGLPPIRESIRDAAICALEPGLIGVAGSTERTWAGTAKLDPETGIKLDVFFEALDKLDHSSPASWQRLETAFSVTSIGAVAGRIKPDAQPEHRMVLPRQRFNSYILLDPQRRSAEFHKLPKGYQSIIGMFDGALFLSDPDGKVHKDKIGRNNVYRIAFPDLKPTLTKPASIPMGQLFNVGERSILAYRSIHNNLKTETPWYETRTFPADLKPIREEWGNELRVPATFVSAHYGLVAAWENRIYQLEWR